MVKNNDEVYDKKPQRYTENNLFYVSCQYLLKLLCNNSAHVVGTIVH